MEALPEIIRSTPPLTFPGKRFTVKVYETEGHPRSFWAIQLTDHTTRKDKWVGAMAEQSDACEYAVWKSKQS